MRVRLTDQALVAVAIGRRQAQEAGRAPTVADLLVGLATESEGLAGHLLRDHGRPATLVDRVLQGDPAAHAPLEAAVRRAAEASQPRPPGTRDLLRAVLEVGGAALEPVLDDASYDPALLRERVSWLDGWDGAPDELSAWRLLDRWDTSWSEASETVGLAGASTPDAALHPHAAVALARTRAVAGGAVELLLAVSVVTGGVDPEGLELADLCLAVESLQRHDRHLGEGWDEGLEPVERAARAWRGGDQVLPVDLVRAAAAVGGEGPAAVLTVAEARRRAERP